MAHTEVNPAAILENQNMADREHWLFDIVFPLIFYDSQGIIASGDNLDLFARTLNLVNLVTGQASSKR
jgi:hypothetical protein